MAAQLAVAVFHRYVGDEHLHLTGGVDGKNPDLFAEPLLQGLDHSEVAFSYQFCFLGDEHSILADVQTEPFIPLGQPFDNQRLDAETGKLLGGKAAGVTFLDSSVRGLFAPAERRPVSAPSFH